MLELWRGSACRGLPVITAADAEPHTGSGISDEQENKAEEKGGGDGGRELVSKRHRVLGPPAQWLDLQVPSPPSSERTPKTTAGNDPLG